MVQPKNKPNFIDHMRKEAEEYNRRNPIIKTEWAVEEVRPAYNTGGYYDQDIPEERKVVSPYFDDEIVAEIWMKDHVADKGKHLEVSEFRTRQINPKPYTQRERVWKRK